MRPILLVDDDSDLRDVIRDVLEDEGLTVETASDGQQAVERVSERRLALLVLDLTLRLFSGPMVADHLHLTMGTTVPILVISGDERAAEIARQVGAFACLRKPFRLEVFLAAVHRGLSSA